MSKDERIYLERIAVALEEKVEIEHPDKGYLDSKTYMERIADAVEQLPSGGGGITPTGNIAITENTAEGEPLDIAQYATATVNVSGGGVDLLHTELTIQNENSADFTFTQEDTLLCAGYALDLEALGSPINFLRTEIIDENDTLGIDLVTKNITIPGNSEVTFMLYYLYPTADCYITPSLNVESVDNMELDDGAYYLINNTSNSSIILSVRK